MINSPDIDPLFRKNKGKLFPSQVTNEEYEIVSEWRLRELFSGDEINFTIESDSNDDIKSPDFDGIRYDDVKFILQEHLNDDILNQNFKNNNFRKMTVFGKVVGPDTTYNWGNEFERNYFVVNNIYVDGCWLEYDEITSICNQFDLIPASDLGCFYIDVKKIQMTYHQRSAKKFVEEICESIMPGVCEFDEGIRSISPFAEEHGVYEPSSGIVAMAEPQLLDKYNNRVQFKLETSTLSNFFKEQTKHGYG
jgi:hypothetical protein